MRPARIASLLLSVFLQLAPLVRVAVADTAALLSPIVALLRWAAGAAAVAGSFHAVSGATGLTITQGTTKTTVPWNSSGTVSGSLTETNGVTVGLKLAISSTQYGNSKSFKATGLPTGLTLTSATLGTIAGTPSASGVFTTTITGYANSNLTGDKAVFNVRITVIDGAPVITAEPQPVTVDAGQSASLTVVATGSSLSYRWIKNGVELPLTTPGATNATLTFNPAKTTDSGDYQVRVANSGGNKLSATVTLTVNAVVANPPVIGTPPSNATVAVGGTASFTVAATGSGTLTYQWSKGASPLNGQTSPTLTLNPVTVDSGGTYTVRVSNAGGFADASAVLTVAPAISAQSPASVVAHAGEAVRLTVTATGPSPLTYQWKRNGEPVPNSNVAELLFDPATADNSGAYVVTVFSPGASAVSGPMNVDVRPLTFSPPRLNGNTVTLNWTAIPGRIYRINSNTTLNGGTWNSIGETTPANTAGAFEAPISAEALFFRIEPR